MPHQVFRVSYAGMPLDHQAIFVETESDGSGQLFEVKGSILDGMRYEQKTEKKPEESMSYQSKILVGMVSTEDIAQIDHICRTIAPPAKQFEGPLRLNPHLPLRRCQEWTADVITQLKTRGIVV